MAHLIGIDLGATRIKAVSLDEHGVRFDARETETNDSDAAPWLEGVRGIVNELEQAHSTLAHSIGLCAPGFASRDARSISWMQGRMAAVQGLDWTDALGRPVRVLNDAHAAALRAHLDRVEWRPHGAAVALRRAQLGSLAGAYGAAYYSRFYEGDA